MIYQQTAVTEVGRLPSCKKEECLPQGRLVHAGAIKESVLGQCFRSCSVLTAG